MKKAKRILTFLCFFTFIVTALTSVPLLLSYVKGTSPKFSLIVDLHVWFGLAFIIFAMIRIINNRKFLKSIIRKTNNEKL